MPHKPSSEISILRVPAVSVLAWLIPGLGHIYLGHKVRGIVFLVTLTLTFWTGVAIGGVKSVGYYRPVHVSNGSGESNLRAQPLWFVCQLMNGPYSLGAMAAGHRLPAINSEGRLYYLAWPNGEIGSLYSGVAGLLNLLVILDALARAQGLDSWKKPSASASAAPGPPSSRRTGRG